jgi:hypothetical protein
MKGIFLALASAGHSVNHMGSIRKLLQENPGLVRCTPADLRKQKRRQRYGHTITDAYNKLEDITEQYLRWVAKMPGWRPEVGEKVFHFGRTIGEDYGLSLEEVDRLFNETLPQRLRGALLGFFMAGMCAGLVDKDAILRLDLSNYAGAVSGLGFRHARGRLEILGDRAYLVGVRMRGGEILLKGNAGNHIGTFMDGGSIRIEGNARNWIGQHMRGGLLRITGNAGNILGKRMSGGELVIEGDAGHWLADDMLGGIIRIRGRCGSVDEERSGGEVLVWREQRWRRIEFAHEVGCEM